MYFSKATVLFSLALSALALPTGGVEKRALSTQSYDQFQISDGVAGNALAEVQANFPIDESDLASVSKADLAIIKAARETAEAAETDAFNPAIDDAGGKNTAAGKALQVGKIKNKVLKLKLETLALQIDEAQTGKDNSEKIAEEQKKLDTNIATDKKSAGQASQSVSFDG